MRQRPDLAPFAVLEGLPTTIFISPAGKVSGVHTGQYGTVAALENDIQRYALGGWPGRLVQRSGRPLMIWREGISRTLH